MYFLPKIGNQMLCICLLFTSVDLYAQNLLSEPESIVYDQPRNRYLVSNQRSGAIVAIDSAKNMRFFNTELSESRGMQIVGDTVYVTSGTRVVGFDLETAAKVLDLGLPGANFLNDVTVDSARNLYVSDSFAHVIFKIRLADSHVTTFVRSGVQFPNGLLYDPPNNRLLLCSFRAASPIQAISLADSSVSTVVNTTFTNLDGLTVDRFGYIYLSSFGDGVVVRYSPDFSQGPEEISRGHAAPADIFINATEDVLAIPNLGADRIDFLQITQPTSVEERGGAIEPDGFRLMQNYPNPFNPSTNIEYALPEPARVVLGVFDIAGRTVRSFGQEVQGAGNRTIVWDGKNDQGQIVASGVYFFNMVATPSSGRVGDSFSKSIKMLLLK